MTTGANSPVARGVALSITASTLFALMFYLAGVVDAPADTVFGWRILITLGFYAATLVLRSTRGQVREFVDALTSTWWTPLVFVLLSALVGFQLWLFAWSPIHGHALDASLGYLLLPLALVLVGRFLFKASVSRVQWISVVIAVVAVALRIGASSSVSWVTFAICFGYALYFAIRTKTQLNSPIAFGFEVALLSPIAVAFLLENPPPPSPSSAVGVAVIGLAGAVAMSAYLATSRILPLPTFGLLSYMEPVLLFVAALLLGEVVDGISIGVYSLLAVSLALLGVDGFRRSPR